MSLSIKLPFGFAWRNQKDESTSASTKTRQAEIELPGYGKLQITCWLNFVGDNCLRTNLVTKKTLAYLQEGEVIEITTDNPSSTETIPFMLQHYNCKHLATLHDEECWKIYVGKGITGLINSTHTLNE